MIVYIGSPIDTSLGSPQEQFEELGNAVIEADPNVLVFNPLTAFMNAVNIGFGKRSCAYVEAINYQALSNADIGVFVWNSSPSFGVPLEIHWCQKLRKPAIVWVKSKTGIYLINALDPIGVMVESRQDLVEAVRMKAKEFKEI